MFHFLMLRIHLKIKSHVLIYLPTESTIKKEFQFIINVKHQSAPVWFMIIANVTSTRNLYWGDEPSILILIRNY